MLPSSNAELPFHCGYDGMRGLGKFVPNDIDLFCSDLRDGTILCEVATKLDPAAFAKVSPSGKFLQVMPGDDDWVPRANIQTFRRWCGHCRLPIMLSYENLRDNDISAIISCLLGLAHLAYVTVGSPANRRADNLLNLRDTLPQALQAHISLEHHFVMKKPMIRNACHPWNRITSGRTSRGDE